MDRKDHVIAALRQQRNSAHDETVRIFGELQEQLALRDAQIAELTAKLSSVTTTNSKKDK
jgi:hypothetical protein